MIKRTLALLMCMILALSVCACGNNNNDNTTTTPSATEKPTVVETLPEIKKPDNIGNMSFSNAFYKPILGAVMYNVDISKAEDYEILGLRCLQGLVARNDSAQIYLSDDQNDSFWITRLTDEYGIIVKNLTVAECFEKFAKKIEGVVNYSADNENSALTAVYLASQNDAIAWPSANANELNEYLQKQVDVKSDTSMIDTAKMSLDKQLETAKGMYAGAVSSNCDFIDYLYAVGAVMVTADDDSIVTQLVKSEKFERPAVLFCENEKHLKTASVNGFGVLDIHGFSNSTLFSSFTNANVNSGTTKGDSALSEETENYASIEIVVDEKTAFGDNMSYLLKNNRRGSTCITFSISPAIYELAPPIASWYSAGRRSITSLSADCTGYMSVDLSVFPAEHTETYFARSKTFINAFRFSIIESDANKAVETKITENLGNVNVLGSNSSVKIINIDNIYSFKDYELPKSNTPFYCIRINACDLTTSTFQQLENLVAKFQQTNDNTEFLLLEDLFATIKEQEKQTATTTTTVATTTTATTTAK